MLVLKILSGKGSACAMGERARSPFVQARDIVLMLSLPCLMQVLLPALHRMVYQADRDRLTGTQLLRLVLDKSSCGVPALQSCCQRLLWHCNQILLSHVRSW